MKTILVAVCLLLTGCAGKPDHARVRIAFLGTVVQPQQMPTALAETLGYFRDEGIDVVTVNLPSYSKTLEALIGGSVDVAGIAYAQTVEMAAEGQRVRAFFIGFRRMSTVLAIAPAANGKIHRVEELRGAVLGIPSPGSPTHRWVNYLLAAHGIRPSEVSAVGIGTGPSAVAAVESGRIDTVGLSGGDPIRLPRRNPSMRILVDGSSPEAMQEVYGGDLYASPAMAAKQSWLDKNPDTARWFARALQKTLPWIARHTPDEIRERLPESSRSPDPSVDLEIIRWSQPMFTSDGRMPQRRTGSSQAFSRSDDVRESKFDLAITWTNEFLPEIK